MKKYVNNITPAPCLVISRQKEHNFFKFNKTVNQYFGLK